MSLLLALCAMLAPAQAAPAVGKGDAIVRYRVKAGDTLFTLGEHYFIRPADYLVVQRLNRVANPRRLAIGRVLRIPRRILRTEPVAGSIAAFRGDVVVTRGGARQAAATGLRVNEGQVLVTGAKAFVTVELPDGSRFSLPSNSRVGIARLRRTLLSGEVERAFRVEHGRSDWDVTPSGRNPFSVETPVATTAVRGTGFRVTYDLAAATSAVGVLEGKVAVSGGDAEALVAAGESAAVGATGEIRTGALIAAPELERPGAVQKASQVIFRAGSVPGASAYGFELAADAGFIDRIAEERSTTPEARFDALPGGTYFVRTTAFDANGVEGRANVYGFDRQLNTIETDEPVVGVSNGRKDYLFRWRGAGGGRAEYRFVLARDAEGRDPIIDEAGLARTNFTVSDLPQGVYFWRVWSIRFENGKHSETVTSSQKLQIGDAR